jgi:hypothetical protein
VAGTVGEGEAAEARDAARRVHRIFVFSQVGDDEGVYGVVAVVVGG